ncbi:MAG: TonB-dependent receptor [Pseudomonadota bacterium]
MGMMMRVRLIVCWLGLLVATASWAQIPVEPESSIPASVTLIVFEQGRPQADLTIRIDDQSGRTDADGTWMADVPAGPARLTLFDGAQPLTALALDFSAGEIAQIIVTLTGQERRAQVSIESSHSVEGALPIASGPAPEVEGSGVLTGRVVSSEDGAPIAAARLFVSGTPVEARTDEDGVFVIELPAGEYSVSVLHSQFATRTIDQVVVGVDQQTQRDFELPPAGLELAEFVVIEPFIEGSLTAVAALRRESTAVTDVISAEQISRAGDGDVGSALKRVTGLTLVGGEFVYVRGLGERYSSVLLNGANLPSPDPTRRVLPMGLFPTDIISQIVVQKTSDASMPGTFGGGTVQMSTLGFPEELLFNISLGTGYNTESTWQDGLTYDGGGRDWTGYDDGTRDVPPLLDDVIGDGTFLRVRNRFNPEGVEPEELELIGEELAGVTDYGNRTKELPADRSFGISLGNSFKLGSNISTGFLASIQYADEWRQRNEARNDYAATNAGLELRNDFLVARTLRNIDFSAFVNTGIDFGDWTSLGVNLMLLRQSEDEVEIQDGTQEAQRFRRIQHEWTENELLNVQLLGEHRVPKIDTQITWQYSQGTATREDPNVVEYRRDDGDGDGVFTFSRRGDSNSQFWANVDDDLSDWSIQARQPLPEWGPVLFTPSIGAGETIRDRVAGRRSFSYSGPVAGGDDELPQNDLLTPDFIGPDGLQLREDTQATDNFIAEQELTTYFAMLETNIFDKVQVVAGVRFEDNFQQIVTENLSSPDAPPIISLIDEQDELWSGSITWQTSEDIQLRFGYSETLSRPDLREISPAPFVDPILDLRTVGNPDLLVTSIENYDARIEYYFNETDSISLAYFVKDLTNPIEKTVSAGASGTTIFLQNALGADVEGWEIDLYRGLGFVNEWGWLDSIRMGWIRRMGLEHFYLAANYADIETSVELDPDSGNQTNLNRALEGASPWVINAQIGYSSPNDAVEWTLLFNSFGERISRAGALGQPDIFEEPFDQLDFVARYNFKDYWSVKLELENILDSKIEFTQGGLPTRTFKPGVTIGLGLQFSL